MPRRLRMGMVGGGPGAFIGPVHRIAAMLDGQIELVAGAFSSDGAKSAAAGEGYGIAADRAYADFNAMFAAERARDDGIDFVTIATPNHTHLAIARAALSSGIAVMSDKPATATLAEADELAEHVARANVPYALSYTYSGYPIVREARALVESGALGSVRKVVVEYLQGWLADPIEAGNKQAGWRVDPAQAGIGGCIGDIGVHALHLAEFVSGRRVDRIAADLRSVVPGRTLDDDATILLDFGGNATGVILTSQVAVGEANGLRLRIYGERASLDWRQEDPNQLELRLASGRTEILRVGDPAFGLDARQATRLPMGHPEGYLEAFANLYQDFARLLRGGAAPLLPGIGDGLRSLAFVDAALRSSAGGGWVTLRHGHGV